MTNELFLAFGIFAAVTLITPGPNNLMLMTSGLNWGAARTLPHLLGVCFGFGFMVLLVGFGLGAVFRAYPWLYAIIKSAGAIYLLYLAFAIGTSGPIDSEEGSEGSPISFLQAALFQWVNPKAWVMAIGAVTTYAQIATFPINVVIMSTVFLVLGFASSGAWVVFGQALRPMLRNPVAVRRFNAVMALLLVASLVPLLWD